MLYPPFKPDFPLIVDETESCIAIAEGPAAKANARSAAELFGLLVAEGTRAPICD